MLLICVLSCARLFLTRCLLMKENMIRIGTPDLCLCFWRLHHVDYGVRSENDFETFFCKIMLGDSLRTLMVWMLIRMEEKTRIGIPIRDLLLLIFNILVLHV